MATDVLIAHDGARGIVPRGGHSELDPERKARNMTIYRNPDGSVCNGGDDCIGACLTDHRATDMAEALEDVFGEHFTDLDGATRLALIDDCWSIAAEDEFADVDYAPTLAQEYRDRIGSGNLLSYARCFQD